MFTHQTTQALPEQPRTRPVTRALRATAAAAALAGAAFMITPSGPAVAASGQVHWKAVIHHFAGNGQWTSQHGNRYAHFVANGSRWA